MATEASQEYKCNITIHSISGLPEGLDQVFCSIIVGKKTRRTISVTANSGTAILEDAIEFVFTTEWENTEMRFQVCDALSQNVQCSSSLYLSQVKQYFHCTLDTGLILSPEASSEFFLQSNDDHPRMHVTLSVEGDGIDSGRHLCESAAIYSLGLYQKIKENMPQCIVNTTENFVVAGLNKVSQVIPLPDSPQPLIRRLDEFTDQFIDGVLARKNYYVEKSATYLNSKIDIPGLDECEEQQIFQRICTNLWYSIPFIHTKKVPKPPIQQED